MTEYTTSSHAIREYLTSRERTAYWIQNNEDGDFYSPSLPPSVLEGWAPSSPVSEAGSSHSIPPRMILRYGDGVPDVPIPNCSDALRSSRSRHRESESRSRSSASPTSPRPSSSRHRAHSGSHPSSPLAQSGPYDPDETPAAPEEIRVLPSAPTPPQPSSFSQPRSKSLPRSVEHPTRYDSAPGLSANPRIRTPYPGATASRALPTLQMPTQPPPMPSQPTSPWHTYSHARPPPHLHKPGPPSIVYAPGNSSRAHYAPPAIYHYPPQVGPNGLIYSHSAPAGSQYPSHAAGSSPPLIQPLRPLTRSPEEDFRGGMSTGRSHTWGHGQGRSFVPSPPPLSRSGSSTSGSDSDDSGSTYYVLPAVGQKVHVLTPSPQPSISTSTPNSPTLSQSFNKKPPFFKRLFSFTGKKRPERRHSLSGVERRPDLLQ